MEILEIINLILVHSVADTLYLIPFLFVTYVFMEWLEHKTGARTKDSIKNAGYMGPVLGAVLGVVPQCGFSASAATLYAGRVVSVGTLMAIFLSTSDEMLPIFVAQKVPGQAILSIMGIKVAIGIVVGLAADLVVRFLNRHDESFRIHEICAEAQCGCTRDCSTCKKYPELVYEHDDDCSHGCCHEHHEHDHSHDHGYGWSNIFKSALIHTLQITIFVFVITLVLNVFLETFGEEALEAVLGGDTLLSMMACALVGLIPNCAASILIAQLYIQGVLGTGAMLSGLLMSAGIGILVLFRTNRDLRQNITIMGVLYVISVVSGFILSLTGIKFF